MTLLNILYDQLDFKSGSLHTTTDRPLSGQNSIDWLEKGEWLSAAKRIGAEKIFFVENNPVAVFTECKTAFEEKVKAFNKAWCLARPRLLFVASPGEITVYDLAQKPIDINNQKDWKNLNALKTLHDLTKVSHELQSFHRDNVESGRLFADKRFGDLKNRADKALIRDLKTVRRELIDAGLSGNRVRFAHALIGRSIFIRYLEDRDILTEDYFLKVARQHAGWTDVLRKPVRRAGFEFSEHETFYPRVLLDQAFTYALFKKLAQDFNGDMFPDVAEEEQIAGIEANDEAARITAFSLYLSMLHYLDPPAIDRQIKMGNRLPNLIATSSRATNHLHCILPKNAFDVKLIESIPVWKERFGRGCADVVVGNPPWGAPGNKANAETKVRHNTLLDWCKSTNKPIGDGEPSQAFLWRALDFLRSNGKAGMLVSAGVLFKHSKTTQNFRRHWFDSVRLEEVFNFSHVRKFFFKGGISPFLSVFFSKEGQKEKPVYYWSPKQTIAINKTQAIALSRYDLHVLLQEDLMGLSTWKEFWFGRPADRKFLNLIRRHRQLVQYSAREESGQGFQVASKGKDADDLQSFRNLVISTFSRYDSPSFSDPPQNVYRLGVISTYFGKRLLVKRGIDEKTVDKGRIIARYETEPFEKEIEAQRRQWERELDEAVFELYELNDEQKGLIRDFCEVTLPFFYRPFDSLGAMQAVKRSDLSWIENYIHNFCLRWNAYFGSDEEMRGEVHIGAHDNMLAVEFYVADKGDSYDLKVKDNSWSYVLDQIGEVLPQPMGVSKIILDGFVHVVSDSGIILIKRNEKRFWTRSLAREDADATICKRMVDTIPKKGRSC